MITIETAKEMIRNNNFGKTEFVCDDGTKVVVSPCYYIDSVSDFNQIDYYLVYGDLPWLGGRTLEEVLNQINHHSELIKENNQQEHEIQAYFDRHQKEGWTQEQFNMYSDWHKDVYGFRPRGLHIHWNGV